MRILYHAAIAPYGGARRHAMAVMRGLEGVGHEVDHMHGKARFLRRVRPRGGGGAAGRLVRLVGRWAGTGLLLASSAERGLALAVRLVRRRPDVILWRPGLFEFHGVLVARLLRVPLVIEMNTPLALEARRHLNYALLGLAARIERYVLARSDGVIAVSEENAGHAVRPDVDVVPNGGGYLDDDEVAAAVRWGREHCLICSGELGSGRFALVLESFRGWHGAAERQAALRALPRGWTALCAGDGPEVDAFRGWVRDADTDAEIVLCGEVDPAGVQHLLAEHVELGFVLYPPLDRFYFSPLKLYDLLAHGVPVVATDVGQVGRIARSGAGGTVELVGPGDLDAVGAAVARVAAAPPRGRRAPVGVLCSPHGWRTAIGRYAAVLETTLGHRKISAAPDRPLLRAG